MKLKLVMFLFIMLFVMQTYAQNNDDDASVGIGPQIGWHKTGDADEGSFMFGAFIRAKLSKALGLEGSINYKSEDYYDGAVSAVSWPVQASVLFYPFEAIYGIAGVGWYFSTVSYEGTSWEEAIEDNTQSSFGFHLGGGVELPLGEMIKLTGDIRYVFLNYDLENIEDVPLSDLNTDYFVITLGLAFGLN